MNLFNCTTGGGPCGIGPYDTYTATNARGEDMEIQNSYALQSLGRTPGVFIRQRMRSCDEVMSCNCCTTRNKFDVFDEEGEQAFYVQETTPNGTRLLQRCFPECAPWEMRIDYLGSTFEGLEEQEAVWRMRKACTPCVCCCINRPRTQVIDAHGNLMGSIKDPCIFIPMNLTFDIQDENGETLYQAKSGCQWGLCCPCPYGECKSVEFKIRDKDGAPVGILVKSTKGCLRTKWCSCCFEDAETHLVEFTRVDDLRSRVLIMALALFTDVRYFTDRGEDLAGEIEG